MAKKTRNHRGSKLPPDPEDDGDKVGYAQPPKATQFKPGQSGNPKGRPLKPPTLISEREKALRQRIPIRIGDRVLRVTRLRAIVLKIMTGALAPGTTNLSPFFKLMSYGTGEDKPASKADDLVSENDVEFLEDFFARYGAEKIVPPKLKPGAKTDGPPKGPEPQAKPPRGKP